MAQEIDHNLENLLYDDVCNIIEQARYRVAVYVNPRLCWWIRMSAVENGRYPPTQNGDIRSLFMLFTLMAMQY